MFTGIVSAVGRVARVTRNGGKGRGRGKGEEEDGLVLTIRAPFRGLKPGESIAVNGACLTVERVVKGGFTVHVVETTEG
ncbi:MAG: riboflavin synthase, partial [Gemmatimonadetes bacterium]